MKKLVFILLLSVSFMADAQRPTPPDQGLTTAQKAMLKTKKMTLQLVLTETQSKAIYPLLLGQMEQREAFKAASATAPKTDRFEKINQRLDAQIAFQNDMKAILDDTQFEHWRAMHKRQLSKGKRRNLGPRNRRSH